MKIHMTLAFFLATSLVALPLAGCQSEQKSEETIDSLEASDEDTGAETKKSDMKKAKKGKKGKKAKKK